MINLHQFKKTYEGFWWAPEDPKDRCYGRLKIRPKKKIELHLISMGKDAGIRFPESPAILLGKSEGRTLTLWNCFQNQSHVRREEIRATYSVQVVLPGCDVSDKDELKFSEAEFTLEHLGDWIGERLIRPTEGKVEFNSNEEIAFKVREGIDGALHQTVNVAHAGPFSTTVDQVSSIILRFGEPKSLGEIKGEMASWRWLISLLIGRPVAETRLAVKNDKSPYGVHHEVLYNPGRSFALPKNLHDIEMVCPFSEIREDIDGLVARWQAIREKYPAVLQRYFSTQFKHGLYTNEEFLFLAHALEAFWRADVGDGPSFKKCVEGCLARMPFFLKKFINERPEFVNEVVSQRNYYTHYNPKYEVLDGTDLYFVGNRMKVLVKALLLQELGLSESIINQLITDHHTGKLIEYR